MLEFSTKINEDIATMDYSGLLSVNRNHETIVRHVIKILCHTEKPLLSRQVRSELSRAFGINLKRDELCSILRMFSNNFTIAPSDRYTDNIVTAISKLSLCDVHCSKKATCSDPFCDSLHICKFYLLSNSCRFSRDNYCRYGHDLTTSHNKKLLRDNYLDHLTIQELQYLFKNVEHRSTSTLPKICKFYNVIDGCRNTKQKKPCPYMHICKFYILGECRFGQRCKRNHDLFDHQVKHVLVKHGINVQRSPKEVLAELQSAGVGDAGDDSVSDFSAASESYGISASRTQESGQLLNNSRSRSVPRLNDASPNLVVHDMKFTISDSDSDDVIVESDSSEDKYGDGATGGPVDFRQSGSQNNSKKPEGHDICIYHLRNKCAFGQSCRKHHKDMPYQWQYFEMADNIWADFPLKQNVDIEFNYCNVHKRECYAELGLGMVVLIDLDKLEGHLSPEQQAHSRANLVKIRRLSTASSCIEKYQPLATDWKWYWFNQGKKWCEYGELDASGYKAEIDSTDLEQNYLENPKGQMRFATLEFEYLMDFGRMEQVNAETKMTRPVRRRPVFVDMKEINKRKKRSAEIDPRLKRQSSTSSLAISSVPPEWDVDRSMSSDELLDHFRRIEISESDPKTRDEYKKVQDLFKMSMPKSKIVCMERIQNGELWMNFVNKREKMRRKNKSGVLNERRLFHGTHHRYVDAICRQGFDFRFSGKSVGTRFGKGSYFTKSSHFADSYTDMSREMFLVLVLAGDTVTGDPSYVRPPPKNPRDPHELYDSCVDDVNSPNIYVIFTFDQVYPQYIIKYK